MRFAISGTAPDPPAGADPAIVLGFLKGLSATYGVHSGGGVPV
jgi:hypothetical protein